MGYSRGRVGREGKRRYTAYYCDVRGLEKSAGTFTSKRLADRAWQAAETKVAEGRVGDPRRGRQRFRDYVEQVWLPNHVVELTTRQNYSYYLTKHLIPAFGTMRMAEILPAHVREWVVGIQERGVSPPPSGTARSYSARSSRRR